MLPLIVGSLEDKTASADDAEVIDPEPVPTGESTPETADVDVVVEADSRVEPAAAEKT
jgi:hypothetical protein